MKINYLCVYFIYILALLLMLRSFHWKYCLSTCQFFVVYYLFIYAKNLSEVSWQNYYLASFLLAFALGTNCFPKTGVVYKKFIVRYSQQIKRGLIFLLSLCFFVTSVILIRNALKIEKFDYVHVRLLLGLKINYFMHMMLFIVGPFLATYCVSNTKSIILKIILFGLVSVIFILPLRKTLLFSFLFVLFLFYWLRISKNYFLSIKKILLGGSFSFLLVYITICIFNKVKLPLSSCIERASNTVSVISYKALSYAQKNKYMTYGDCSFHTLYKNFSEKDHIPLDKITMAEYTNSTIQSIPMGAGANTPMPIPLYVDFRWFALLFAFLLGIYLRTHDELAFKHFKSIGFTPCTTLSYCCSLWTALEFNITAMGTCLLSGGMVLFSMFLWLFSNLES